jgi:hypothetical protein
MRFLRFTDRALSSRAEALIQFDMDSLRQVAHAKTGIAPELWLADPDLYERDGRVLRDSTTPRLLAYTPQTRTLYVTDGCNSCTHDLVIDLTALSDSEIEDFSKRTNIRSELLQKLAAAIH